MLLSVIIPVYNVAGTLKRCVDSVLAQGVDGMEVILVDDGSTDVSPQICDEYAEKGVRVLHQPNGGLSEARNAGISVARGRYITFVDSDDYLSSETYPELLRLAETTGADILEYSLTRQLRKGSAAFTLPDSVYQDMTAYWLEAEAYAHTYACNKIYRRELFSAVRFPKGRRFEDVPTLWRLIHVARRVVTTSKGCYHYTLNPDGITQKADGEAYRDLLDAHLSVLASGELSSCRGFREYYRHVLDIQLQTYIYTGNTADILLPALHFTGSLKLWLLNFIGMRALCRLTRCLSRG